ncbi:ABC transporter substrate-binding protein [Anaerolineales bacterium HSG24]|nr:ABC transporter substrate-binding protein [Anaerolineales bacterium HSG24]
MLYFQNDKTHHPAVLDMQSDLRKGKISRREFLRFATLLGVSATTAGFMAGCGNQPAAPSTPTPSPIKRGGVMKIGTALQDVSHPARLSWIESANVLRQVAEYLTETGADGITRPWLLERWEANEDVTMWTLFLNKGIKFNNGQDFTVDDVIFNFEQWLDPTIESSMGDLLSYLSPTNIERLDDYTIRLHLDSPQIGIPEHLFHYPALIMSREFEGDFIKQPLGTGPFTLAEYTLGDQAVCKRRSDYWHKGADGAPLPYLDELIYIELEVEDRIEAIQGGGIDTLYTPTPQDWKDLKDVPDVSVYDVSTAQTFVLRMRVDQPPWNDVRVRQALKLCQDRQKILDGSYSGQGELGIDAHVAPIHPAYCEKPIPKYDPEKAKALLAEAGYPDGLQVKLTTKNDRSEPEMSRILRNLAAPAGFDIELNIIEPAKYWEQWTEVELGITTWTHRPLGTMVLSLAYTSDKEGKPVSWNETHWVDEEFNTLLGQAERTLDIPKRREIMCQLEDIMQTRGPIGISYWRKLWTIIRTEFKNVRAHPTAYDLFYDVWKDV